MRPVTGRELIRLLELDGWTRAGRRTHGIFLWKRFEGENIARTTVVPDKSQTLPRGTLGAILGIKQTGLGAEGLTRLVELYG